MNIAQATTSDTRTWREAVTPAGLPESDVVAAVLFEYLDDNGPSAAQIGAGRGIAGRPISLI
jgi:hypothetical protein